MLALRNCLSPSQMTKSVLSSLAQCFLHRFLRLMAAELAIGCGHAETKGGVEVFDGLKTLDFAIEAFEQAFELEDEGIFVG